MASAVSPLTVIVLLREILISLSVLALPGPVVCLLLLIDPRVLLFVLISSGY